MTYLSGWIAFLTGITDTGRINAAQVWACSIVFHMDEKLKL